MRSNRGAALRTVEARAVGVKGGVTSFHQSSHGDAGKAVSIEQVGRDFSHAGFSGNDSFAKRHGLTWLSEVSTRVVLGVWLFVRRLEDRNFLLSDIVQKVSSSRSFQNQIRLEAQGESASCESNEGAKVFRS